MGESTVTVALAGNPNVGKSTVFNALTGSKQHTGNWTGKTVSSAKGSFSANGENIELYDIPGTYSLTPHSREESVAREFICFGGADKCAVVCDASSLERNLFLVYQIAETGADTAVCVNLLDEAKKHGINIDIDLLSHELRMPVTGTSARSGEGLDTFVKMLCKKQRSETPVIKYTPEIENAVETVQAGLVGTDLGALSKRWVSLRLLENDGDFLKQLSKKLGSDITENEKVSAALANASAALENSGINKAELNALIAEKLYEKASQTARAVTVCAKNGGSAAEKALKIDRIVTGRFTSYLILFVMLAFVFYITVIGANYPSEWLSHIFGAIGSKLFILFDNAGVPIFWRELLLSGGYGVLSWVVCVMLPPMAIFFPCFTLLEDLGFLPRVAYVLDRGFRSAGTNGKQSLCVCMGFGCNCVGVEGARIIDSKRERLIAVLTNSVTPCNGRFPAIIKLISIFVLCGRKHGAALITALCLSGVLVFSLASTLLISSFLSKTLLRGEPSHYILELPPYRRPQWGKVIVRSVFERTLFVLGRAAAVAFPAGVVIWLLANIGISGGLTPLAALNAFFELPGRALGLDGETLAAFFLGLPANETVLPIALMSYSGAGVLNDGFSVSQTANILITNGWTLKTALCFCVFSLLHFPCSTTLITIFKETRSLKYTVISFIVPTAFGAAVCAVLNAFF